MPDNPKTKVVYRFLGHLTRDTLALVLAGGRGTRLHELTDLRAKPAVHFGGKYRIIDFPLSNCVNSGIRKIAVLTQYKSHSLIRHLVRGWSHFKKELGEFVEILPASQRYSSDWYQGTADAIYQNIDIIRAENPALRPPDAIQLACAMTERCQLFLTNDNRLTSITGITNLKVQSLTDWMNNPS